MLNGLQEIDWTHLTHAYGSAVDTPGHIINLLSPYPRVCENAAEELWNSLCHQGTVFEATSYAVPFITELLDSVPDNQKIHLISLLDSMANRGLYAHRDDTFLECDWETSDYIYTSYAQIIEHGNKHQDAIALQRAHDAVAAGIPHFIEILLTSDRPCQFGILQLLSGFKEHHALILPTLEKLLQSQPDSVFLAALLLCQSTLVDVSSPAIVLFRTYCTEHADSTVRYAATIALINSGVKEPPLKALSLLVETIIDAKPLTSALQELQFLGSPTYLALPTLRKISPKLSLPALIQVLNNNNTSKGKAVGIAESILDIAFFQQPIYGRGWSSSSHENICFRYSKNAALQLKNEYFDKESRSVLKESIYAALQAVIECDSIWRSKTNLLEIYGLPASREEARKLLQQ